MGRRSSNAERTRHAIVYLLSYFFKINKQTIESTQLTGDTTSVDLRFWHKLNISSISNYTIKIGCGGAFHVYNLLDYYKPHLIE